MFTVDSFSRVFVVKNVSTLMGKVIACSGSSFQYIRAFSLLYFTHSFIWFPPELNSWDLNFPARAERLLLVQLPALPLVCIYGCWTSLPKILRHYLLLVSTHLSVDQQQHSRKCCEATSGEVQSRHRKKFFTERLVCEQNRITSKVVIAPSL